MASRDITGTGLLVHVVGKLLFLSPRLLTLFFPGLLSPCGVRALLCGKLPSLFILCAVLTWPGPLGHPASISVAKLSLRPTHQLEVL